MVKSKNDIAFEILVLVIITLVGLACLIPILFVISYSLTPMEEMLRNGGFSLIPRNITFSAYKQMLNDPTLMNAMKVSAFITIVGTAANLVVTLMLAYPLSRSYLPGRKVFVQLIVFTMIFSAGTIPTYLIVKATGILNTLWALILPSLVLLLPDSWADTITPYLPSEAVNSDSFGPWSALGVLACWVAVALAAAAYRLAENDA